MPRSERAVVTAASAGVTAFCLAFAAVSALNLRLPVYNPEHRVWRFFYKGWGYWMDWYGRSAAAVLAGLLVGAGVWVLLERIEPRKPPTRFTGLVLAWETLLALALAVFFATVSALAVRTP